MSQLAAPSVTLQPMPRTHVAPLDHAEKAQALAKERAMRAADSLAVTAEVFLFGNGPEAMRELLKLQRAAWNRFATLQKSWTVQWQGWLGYADKIKGANTFSKLFEMESNIASQAAAILGAQLTDLVTLQENIEVDYAYLMKQLAP